MDRELLKIIGTAHVSEKSVEEVKETILNTEPEVVAVELCFNRYNNLKNQDAQTDRKKTPRMRDLMKGDQLTMFLASSFLSYMQQKIGDEVGVKPGAEMMAAVEAAEEIGAKIALIDRDISVTLQRALNQMSLWEKTKFFFGIITSFFHKDDTLNDIESLKEGDTLAEVMEYFQEMSPKAYKVLVDERDAYMARMLLKIPEEKVVAVVGAGHKEGIIHYLDHVTEIPPLKELMDVNKPKISIGKVIMFTIPALFIIIFILAFAKGINLQTSIINYILLTGGLAFLGSILTGSRIYSAITAFIVAPMTVIHPLLAAGWFAGIVEAKLRKVSLDDLAELPKCDSFKEMLNNNLFRVLLVVVGANIGASIGAFLSIPNVIMPLINQLI